jgi:hypothetical protein
MEIAAAQKKGLVYRHRRLSRQFCLDGLTKVEFNSTTQPTPLDRTCQPRISMDYVRILVGRTADWSEREASTKGPLPTRMRSQFAVVGPLAEQNRRLVRLAAMLRAPHPTMCRMSYSQVLSAAASVARPDG